MFDKSRGDEPNVDAWLDNVSALPRSSVLSCALDDSWRRMPGSGLLGRLELRLLVSNVKRVCLRLRALRSILDVILLFTSVQRLQQTKVAKVPAYHAADAKKEALENW